MANDKIKVRWEADDGYCGGSRPQSFSLDIADMAESCETEDEALQYLWEEVDQELRNKVTVVIRNEDEVIEAWKNRRADNQKGDA